MKKEEFSAIAAALLIGAVIVLAGCATGRGAQRSAESAAGAVAGQAAVPSDKTGQVGKRVAARQQEREAAEQAGLPQQEKKPVEEARQAGAGQEAAIPERVYPVRPHTVELDLTEIWPSDYAGRVISINNGEATVTTDAAGKITFEMPETDTLLLSLLPCTDPAALCSITVPVTGWMLPYSYTLMPDGSVTRRSPWVEFRSLPAQVTHEPQHDVLCKSGYPASVSINGQEVKQYKTGIFFRTIQFSEGLNTVRAEAVWPDGRRAVSEQEIYYEKIDRTRQPYPLWIEEGSVEPAADMELLPDEVVRVSFRGSKGQEGWIDLEPGEETIRCRRSDFSDYSLYSAELPLRGMPSGVPHVLSFRLVPAEDAPSPDHFLAEVSRSITVRNPEEYPLLEVKNEYSRLVYNLGAPRLGGPIRSELGPGVILKSSGRVGSNYRIRLSNTETGFISEDDVMLHEGSTIQPLYSVTSMSCGPSARGDVVTIPYLGQVPWEVYPDPGARRLVITIFGAESAATWVSHYKGCRVVDKLTWEQATPETFRVYVNLKDDRIWGYDIKPSGRNLVLTLKYPPRYDLRSAKPLTGLKIAVEAGHGGSGLGAVGLSGLPEKDVNLDLSFRLGDLLASMGAEVVQVREADVDMTLLEKRSKAISVGADILLSIHANAGGRGYLSVSGTSTYWHNPFWAPLARSIYDRLLETGLKEFGVVGSFNYTVTRTTQMPAILVEQAFMSHAEDEERLADPLFRQQMAVKIYMGLIDYLRYMQK